MSVLLGLGTTFLFAVAGQLAWKRRVDAPDKWANRSFAMAWYAGSMVILVPTLRTVLAIAGAVDPALHTALDVLDNLPLAVALGGLMYYLLYLVTGRSGLWKPIAVAYAGYLLYLNWYTTRLGERQVVVGPWQAELTSANPPSGAESLLFGLLLALPILFMVGTYGAAAFHTRDAGQRYRILMIASAFVLLFASVLVAYALHWDVEPWFPLTYEVPGLVAAAMVVAAYRPPRPIQSWLHVAPVEGVGGPR